MSELGDNSPKGLNSEEVLQEAEQILIPQGNSANARPLSEKLSSLLQSLSNPDNLREALVWGFLIGHAVVWPIKTIFSAPFNFVNALKEDGYPKTAYIVGSAGIILPTIVTIDAVVRGESPEVVALRGISAWGMEGFAAMALHTSFRQSHQK